MQNLEIEKVLYERKEVIDEYIENYLSEIKLQSFVPLQELKKSVEYSLLQGGKRFRPALSLMLAEEFGIPPQRILPFAAAIEMIHAYSLIHDDLPCMDNDDFRRGEPTNHKVFGESVALLAGDALLTEAFGILANHYIDQPKVAILLVLLLSEAAGLKGMVGGQAIDMRAKGNLPSQKELTEMHFMKTGALIRVCCEGVSVMCNLTDEKRKLCRQFGEYLGFAFQLADDLLDSHGGKIEKGSFPDLIGIQGTKSLLLETSQKAKLSLQGMGLTSGNLYNLVDYNMIRKK